MAVKPTESTIDLTDAPFSEEQRECVQQYLGRLADGSSSAGKGAPSPALASGDASRDTDRESQSMRGYES